MSEITCVHCAIFQGDICNLIVVFVIEKVVLFHEGPHHLPDFCRIPPLLDQKNFSVQLASVFIRPNNRI